MPIGAVTAGAALRAISGVPLVTGEPVHYTGCGEGESVHLEGSGRAVRVDLHQHLLPSALLAALRARTEPPMIDGNLAIPFGDDPYPICAAEHDVAARVAGARQQGVDQVVLSLSPALGVEYLPGAPGEALLDTWHEAAAALPSPFSYWASCAVMAPDPNRVSAVLSRPGVVGLQLPADALTPARAPHLGPVLSVAEAMGMPVLVHPGRASTTAIGAMSALPPWWTPVVDYVNQLHVAWHTWLTWGQIQHPRLRVAFVALAGLAPLHDERRAARGGDPRPNPLGSNVFYETSSYGPATVAMLSARVGDDVLVYGSDLPNAAPASTFGTPFLDRAVFQSNPHRLLRGDHE